MPSRKDVPRLQDMSIKSIAFNICSHAKKFDDSRSNDKELYRHYTGLQRKFSDVILMALEDRKCGKKVRSDLMACPYEKIEQLCVIFLFNKHTTRINFQSSFAVCGHRLLPPFWQMRECEKLNFLVLKGISFCEEDFIESLPQWPKLLEVDLTDSVCMDGIIMGIFDHCPYIEILKVNDKCVSNRALFHLCEYQQNGQKFVFCEENGNCCSRGKYLTHLTMHRANIDYDAKACAFQHLHSLIEIQETEITSQYTEMNTSLCTAFAIRLLINENKLRCRPAPVLKLKSLFIPKYVLRLLPILECCPCIGTVAVEATMDNMECFTENTFATLTAMYFDFCTPLMVVAYSRAFHRFLRIRGGQLRFISISTKFALDTEMLREILRCCPNLKQFHVGRKRYFRGMLPSVSSDDQEENNEMEIFPCVKKLEKIWFNCLELDRESVSVIKFVSRVLSDATKLKSLTLCGKLAEHSLMEALQVNSFCHLEEISVYCASLENISLEPLLTADSCLKKIVIEDCEGSAIFRRHHEEIAWMNNFDLKICDRK